MPAVTKYDTNFDRILKRKGMTMAGVALALGVQRQSLWYSVRRSKTPSVRLVYRLATLLRVSVNSLVDHDGHWQP